MAELKCTGRPAFDLHSSPSFHPLFRPSACTIPSLELEGQPKLDAESRTVIYSFYGNATEELYYQS